MEVTVLRVTAPVPLPEAALLILRVDPSGAKRPEEDEEEVEEEEGLVRNE